MTKQLNFEDITEGMELPTLEKRPTTKQLVQYAGASGDFYPIHYDQDFARANGLPSVIVHGALKSAFLAQLLTDWTGERGTLKRLSVQYRGMDVSGDKMLCKGKVTRKLQEGGQSLVECDIWIENASGEAGTKGTAMVALPSRGTGSGV